MEAISRRDFGKLAAYLGILSVTGYSGLRARSRPMQSPIGCADAVADESAWRVLNRAGFGPRPGDLERVQEIGVHSYIDEQLAPESLVESSELTNALARLETLELDPSEARDFENVDRPDDIISPVLRTLMQLPNPSLALGPGQTTQELRQARVLRATYSRCQLREVMVEFWTDHFNIDQGKSDCAWLKTADDRQIRRHALGNFRDLLSASAHSPAMLTFLDNTQNFRADLDGGPASNENYARELLELHTLGVDGGYSQTDVQEVARCFTGWGVSTGLTPWTGQFAFNADRHDSFPKVVLGHSIAAGRTSRDGEDVIDLLARHPSTAIFISRKLCERFIADDAPHELVGQLAECFRRTGGNIREVLVTLFHSPQFLQHAGPKLKRPFEFVVSALRAVDAETTGMGVLPHLQSLGQLPFRNSSPEGYPDYAEAWRGGMLARWNFAIRLAMNDVNQTRVPYPSLLERFGESEPRAICHTLSRLILGRVMPETHVEAMTRLADVEGVERAIPQWTALMFSSPSFQWR